MTVLKKRKIATISENLIKDNSSQGKDQLVSKLRKEAFLFHYHLCQRTYFGRVFLLFIVH